ncbi:MAG TPA: hypothetical protein VFB58_04845 [Chloroflexota bacterium]|nr:hypothetical protein [Chloroflexota bacterium]
MSIVLKSFAELAEALEFHEPIDERTAVEVSAAESVSDPSPPPCDLPELLTELQAASAALAAIARRDQEARTVALHDLERYDAVVARQREAEQAHEQARQVREQAERLTEQAFAEEARTEARRVADIAVQAEQAAERAVAEWSREAEALAAGLDLERLLAERRRQEEAEKAKAAEAEKARRLAGALARARVALNAGRIEEAKGLLGNAANDYPDNPEIDSLKTIIAQRELAVKVDAAEEALWEARRAYRRDASAAVARLETVDIDGLPEPLARQVFGEWARACSRLCRELDIAEPLRYAPDPGCGAVIARETSDGPYVVVSALGMGTGWQAGSTVGDRQMRRARPLR